MLDRSCQPHLRFKHSLKDRKDDLYETPSIATEKLIHAEKIPHGVWEPACGRGAIASVLAKAGHHVYSSDLVDYGYGVGRIDFLMERQSPLESIVTNPPFKLAAEFARHAIKLCPFVAMLVRISFLESESRSDVIGKLSRVHVFAKRLPMMHRDGWVGPKASNSIAFAWFVWDRSHIGPTTLDRI